MAAPNWTIRNYNVFLREARKEYDLSLGEARILYREVRDWKVGSAYGADVARYKAELQASPELVAESMLFGAPGMIGPVPSEVYDPTGEYPVDFLLGEGAEIELTAETYKEQN